MITDSITIPRTVEDAVSALSGLDRLLTAKQWERAAIVYAFTDRTGRGGSPDRASQRSKLTFGEFADLGIAGLSSHNTVAIYHDAWQSAVNSGKAKPVRPGDRAQLPDMEWPPTDYRTGNFQQRIITQVRNAEPETRAEVARELLSDSEVIAQPSVQREIVEQAASNPKLTAQTFERASEKRPAPPRPVREPSGLDYAAALGVGTTAVMAMRRIHEDVSTLVAAMRHDALRATDSDAIREDIAALRKAADIARAYADELEITLEGGVSDDRLQALLEGGV